MLLSCVKSRPITTGILSWPRPVKPVRLCVGRERVVGCVERVSVVHGLLADTEPRFLVLFMNYFIKNTKIQ